ncbi:MAG TPA: Calx-beta domain-containing protein, partial [Luteolibacter sp.]|nr:Calx-beta domain-containing protein [Luteolibacter sp.]
MKTQSIVCGALCLCVLHLRAAVPLDFVVDLKAVVSDTSPHIVLSWTQRVQSNITAQKIHRRLKGATTWTKLADLTTTQTSYTDTTATTGIEYEYWMERNLSGLSPTLALGYLSAGVKVPEVHDRGILLLVVDDTMVVPLAPEISQLRQDLTGDGWTVQTITAPRTGTAVATKALITTAYNANPSLVNCVYLLGHVPVPYSGNQAPDGHVPDHVGAWPADGYYGDMNGTWTDTSVNNSGASSTRNDNIPGDGKFDQTSFPSLVELEVGRVDLHKMTKAPNSSVGEISLLRRYLKNAHDFRHKQGAYAAIPRRSLIRDGFGHAFSSEPFAVNGWAGAYSCVGTTVDQAGSGQWFGSNYAGGKDYLLGHGCGGGSYESASSFGATADLGFKPSRVVFMSLFGSYHGDWDADNNLMRAVLAGNPYGNSLGLTCFWGGRPNWFTHTPGMGETMGHMARLSMNAGVTGGGTYQPGGSSFRGVHIGLLGDPALRMHAVEPPRNLTGTSISGAVNLSWNASLETSLEGYHVYRADSPEGPFVRLTTAPIPANSFIDSTGIPGTRHTYLVRTLKSETVPGGSYYNLSIGSPVDVTVNGTSDAIPASPGNLVVNAGSGAALLSWSDNATGETGYRIERKTNATGTFEPLATLPENATSYSDAGPFVHGGVYHYRVIATGAAGDSAPGGIESFEAVAGFLEFTSTRMKVNKSAGTATLNVTRAGGAIGAVSVTCTTSNVSAIAGTHYTSTTATLSWANGETGPKPFTVPITNTSTPQLPRQFKVTLSAATGSASISVVNPFAVQIEDPTATLASPWTSGLIGTPTDHSPAVSAEGVIGDATLGGDGAESGDTAEAGRFIHQTRSGNGVMVVQVPTPIVNQSGARFALMIRASTATNAIMAATMVGSSAA